MTTTIETISVNLQQVAELIETDISNTELEESGEVYTEITCNGIDFLIIGHWSCYWESDGDSRDPQNTTEAKGISVEITSVFSNDEMRNEYEFSDSELSKIESLLNSRLK